MIKILLGWIKKSKNRSRGKTGYFSVNAVNSSKLKYHEHLARNLSDPKTSKKPIGKY